MLPNFLCLGAQKSGTTSLQNILLRHPEIYLPSLKETGFFSNDRLYNKGIAYYEKQFFSQWSGEKAVGEIDPSYIYFNFVPRRIFKCLGGEIKLIFIFRNPVYRAYSHYNMSRKRGYEKEDFQTAIRLEKERLSKEKDIKIKDYYSYIDRGYYSRQVERYLNYFSKDNMLFIIFEEFIADQANCVISILEFLDLDWRCIPKKINIVSNPSGRFKSKLIRDLLYKPMFIKKLIKPFIPLKILTNVTKAIERKSQVSFTPPKLEKNIKNELLEDYFIDDIRRLERLINKDLSIWYSDIT